MGYALFCIPLTIFACVIGYLHQILTGITVVYLTLFAEEPPLYVVVVGVIYAYEFCVLSELLIIGISERNADFISPYVWGTVVAVSFALIAMCIYIFVSIQAAVALLAFIILSCLVTYPIYLLYDEITDEDACNV